MEKLKLTFDWGRHLLRFQNQCEDRNFCDLKLVALDGYILCHGELIPNFRQTIESRQNDMEQEPSGFFEEDLKQWNLQQLSKFLLLLYTGEAITSKKDKIKLTPLFKTFQCNNFKTSRISKNQMTTRRRSQLTDADVSKWTSLAKLKVRAMKSLDNNKFDEIFIYGDGSEMCETAVPLAPISPSALSSNVYFGENGDEFYVQSENEFGFLCHPCSMIFCDKLDYLTHIMGCAHHNAPSDMVRVVKMDPDFIKIEPENHNYAVNFHQSLEAIKTCLICVTGCKDASDLILHSHARHGISPETDYDLSSWTCRLCHSTDKSGQMAIFFQHVLHCKNRKLKPKKRSLIRTEVNKENGVITGKMAKRRKLSQETQFTDAQLNKAHGSHDLCSIKESLIETENGKAKIDENADAMPPSELTEKNDAQPIYSNASLFIFDDRNVTTDISKPLHKFNPEMETKVRNTESTPEDLNNIRTTSSSLETSHSHGNVVMVQQMSCCIPHEKPLPTSNQTIDQQTINVENPDNFVFQNPKPRPLNILKRKSTRASQLPSIHESVSEKVNIQQNLTKKLLLRHSSAITATPNRSQPQINQMTKSLGKQFMKKSPGDGKEPGRSDAPQTKVLFKFAETPSNNQRTIKPEVNSPVVKFKSTNKLTNNPSRKLAQEKTTGVVSTLWKCHRCSTQYTKQKYYMSHSCKLTK